jgi:hypothetical protein
MEAPDTLHNPEWVPRRAVVDDDVAELQVDGFATRLRRNEEPGHWLSSERGFDSLHSLQVVHNKEIIMR